jgi:hypothetical protein
MTRLSQIGWACACLALLAPSAARADSVSVMTSFYEASFLQLPAESAQGNAPLTIFSWCRRCSAPDASPNLVSSNLSSMSSAHHDGGFTFGFGGSFTAVFNGIITFPVPAVSSTTATDSSGPSITLPSAREDEHGDHNGLGPVSLGGGGGPKDKVKDKIDHVAGNGRIALTKAGTLAATPEPATLFLLGTGLVSIAGRRAWKRFA